MTTPIKTLEQIASASPCVRDAGSARESSCPVCLTLIDHARDGLGYEPWPAIPATPSTRKQTMKPGETYYVRLGTKPEPITIKEHGPKRRTKAALLAELEIANQEVARLENEVATANKMRFDYNAEVAELNRRLATTTSNYEARGRQIEAIRVVIGRIPSAPQPMSHTATRTSPSLPPHTTDLALDLGQAQAFLASIYALLYA